ncbi:MAG: hypothetical protein U1F50_08205 [Rubrivivax sp.]
MAEPTPAAGALAFVEGAAALQEAGARLAALAEGTSRRVAERMGALDALPSSALFDPFAAGIAAGQAAVAEAPAEQAAPRRRAGRAALASPAPTGTALRRWCRRCSGGAGPWARWTRPCRPCVRRPTLSTTGGARSSRAIASTPDAKRGTAGALGAVAQAAARANAALPPGQVGASDLPSLALQGTAGLGRLVADLIARVDVGPKPAAATPAAPDPSSPVAAMVQIERQIGQMAIALVGAGVRTLTEPPSRATTAAPRAPSRLLQDISDFVAAATAAPPAPGAPANQPNTATPTAPGTAGPSEEDVAAAINRRLVDQAWLRGVDLR